MPLAVAVDELDDRMGSNLRVGSFGRFQGVYHAHWEWSRFELAVPSRWVPRNRPVLCELVPGDAPFPTALAAPTGRHHPATRIAVTVDADVIAHGNFGHRGTLRWRLLVRRWVAVERLG
jgi:hypothetical protein